MEEETIVLQALVMGFAESDGMKETLQSHVALLQQAINRNKNAIIREMLRLEITEFDSGAVSFRIIENNELDWEWL